MRGSLLRRLVPLVATYFALAVLPWAAPAEAQVKKPNILFIMGDDIGWMQPSIYHRGLMVGETPNIDRIGNDGAIFMDYVAMQIADAVLRRTDWGLGFFALMMDAKHFRREGLL